MRQIRAPSSRYQRSHLDPRHHINDKKKKGHHYTHLLRTKQMSPPIHLTYILHRADREHPDYSTAGVIPTLWMARLLQRTLLGSSSGTAHAKPPAPPDSIHSTHRRCSPLPSGRTYKSFQSVTSRLQMAYYLRQHLLPPNSPLT